MLTSHHYLLGSLFAVLCAIGTAPPDFNVHSTSNSTRALNQPGLSEPDAPLAAPTTSDTLDISYRGSGRLDDEPTGEKQSKRRGYIAHRGSGRVFTQPL